MRIYKTVPESIRRLTTGFDENSVLVDILDYGIYISLREMAGVLRHEPAPYVSELFAAMDICNVLAAVQTP